MDDKDIFHTKNKKNYMSILSLKKVRLNSLSLELLCSVTRFQRIEYGKGETSNLTV